MIKCFFYACCAAISLFLEKSELAPAKDDEPVLSYTQSDEK